MEVVSHCIKGGVKGFQGAMVEFNRLVDMINPGLFVVVGEV